MLALGAQALLRRRRFTLCGIARGLDVPNPRYVCSPTFTLHRVYRGRHVLNHLDFYRLGAEGELEDLGVEEALGAAGIAVIRDGPIDAASVA